MARTTPPPRMSALEVWPELGEFARITVRLHPRRGKVVDPAASKLGGQFLWPADEPWPKCTGPVHRNCLTMNQPYPPGTEVKLVPVLQLRAEDFPEVQFFPGTNLLQLLWCPLDHEPINTAKPFLFWRKIADVAQSLTEMPASELADDGYVPMECELHPERVTEFPEGDDFPEGLSERERPWCEANLPREELQTLDDWVSYYDREHSACPANKVGGFPHWIQGDETPICGCGHRMDYLLTLTDSEFDGANWQRWCPLEDRALWQKIGMRPSTLPRSAEEREALEGIRDPARFLGFVGGEQYVFVCRRCPGWPSRSVYQR